MRRLLVLIGVLALAPPALAAVRPTLPIDRLLRVATALTGIKARPGLSVEAVPPATLRARAAARVGTRFPPALQAYDERLYRALGLLGPSDRLRPALVRAFSSNVDLLVDRNDRRVSVRDGANARTLATEGLVRLLVESAYGLSKHVAGTTSGSDARSAAAAAGEGAATIITRTLPSSPTFAPHARTRIDEFLGLEAAFPSAVGTRLAANLYNVGGSPALRALLADPPTTTEQVFHIEKYLARERALPVELPAAAAGFTLAESDTFGELDVRALLAVFQVPRLDRVGSGWGAGLSALYRGADGQDAIALRLDWDTERDAQEWGEAAALYVNEAFSAETPGPPTTTACPGATCWEVGGRSIAFVRNGSKTAFAIARSVPSAAALAGGVTGPA
jgi:hypothetical protein